MRSLEFACTWFELGPALAAGSAKPPPPLPIHNSAPSSSSNKLRSGSAYRQEKESLVRCVRSR